MAAGEDGGRDLVELCGGQNEHQVLRRLLQDFQKGVEGGGGEHVDLVHDINPLADVGGGVNRFVPEGPDLIHAVVGGGVQLQHVQEAAAVDSHAGGALPAGVPLPGRFAVDGLGQNLGAGGFPGAPGACEEVGMGGPSLGHLTAEGFGDMLLTDDVGKGLGPPFSIEGLIHGRSPSFLPAGAFQWPGRAFKFCSQKKRESSPRSCGAGCLAAHETFRLMLLGSPPDMVRRASLRETGSAAACGGLLLLFYYILSQMATENFGWYKKITACIC